MLIVFAALLTRADFIRVCADFRENIIRLRRPSLPVLIPTLLVLLSAVGIALYYRHLTPPTSYVDGTYISSCCSPVSIRDGDVTMGGEHARLVLKYEKYGLAGRLDRPMGILFSIQDGQKVPVELVFDGNRGFSTPYGRSGFAVYRRTLG